MPSSGCGESGRGHAPCWGHHCPFSPPVESLRHLILGSLLQGQRPEAQPAGDPEDDLTPTPSLGSSTCHPTDPGSQGHGLLAGEEPERGDAALCSLEQLPPRARNSGIWESPELDRNPEEEASSSEAAGSYQVVRKGKMKGTPPMETDPQLARVRASLQAA